MIDSVFIDESVVSWQNCAMKTCVSCRETKSETEFYKRYNRPGLKPSCKKCTLAYNKLKRGSRAGKSWIKTEEQREKHKDGCRARYTAYVSADPDFCAKQHARRLSLVAARGEESQFQAAGRERAKRHYRKNSSNILSKDREKREFIVRALGASCATCGYDADVRALCLDHIAGDGYLDRKRLGSKVSRYYYKNLDEARRRLQVLCANCNMIKAHDNLEHNRSRRVCVKVAA